MFRRKSWLEKNRETVARVRKRFHLEIARNPDAGRHIGEEMGGRLVEKPPSPLFGIMSDGSCGPVNPELTDYSGFWAVKRPKHLDPAELRPKLFP